jgi:hypothetical protein
MLVFLCSYKQTMQSKLSLTFPILDQLRPVTQGQFFHSQISQVNSLYNSAFCINLVSLTGLPTHVTGEVCMCHESQYCNSILPTHVTGEVSMCHESQYCNSILPTHVTGEVCMCHESQYCNSILIPQWYYLPIDCVNTNSMTQIMKCD